MTRLIKLFLVFLAITFGGLLILGSHSALAATKTFKVYCSNPNATVDVHSDTHTVTCSDGSLPKQGTPTNNQPFEVVIANCEGDRNQPKVEPKTSGGGADAKYLEFSCATGEVTFGDTEGGTKKSQGGDCGKGYIKISVPLENGNDCIKESAGAGKNNPIYVFLRSIIKFLSAGVGIIIVLMIIISGIQYITSASNPDATAAAKKRLANAVIALLLFIFMFAILQFLIPGGLFE